MGDNGANQTMLTTQHMKTLGSSPNHWLSTIRKCVRSRVGCMVEVRIIRRLGNH